MSLRTRVWRPLALALVSVGLVVGQGVLAPAHAEEVLTQGGFEDSSSDGDSPSWTESDSVFGSPICFAACGLDPRSGTYWAWFGGSKADGHTASISQSVTIPPGAATLTYWLRVGSAPAPHNATLTVQIDSTVLRVYTDTAEEDEFTQRSFDVSGFADGAAHTLSFSYLNPGPTSVSPGFHLDDVSLDVAPDTMAPDTKLTSSPTGGVATSLTVPITFTSTEANSTFSCRLDSGAATPCTSPDELTVTPGSHTFTVAATDASGNADLTPASVVFAAHDCTTLRAAATSARTAADAAARAVTRAAAKLKKAKRSHHQARIKKAMKRLRAAKAAKAAADTALVSATAEATPCA